MHTTLFNIIITTSVEILYRKKKKNGNKREKKFVKYKCVNFYMETEY